MPHTPDHQEFDPQEMTPEEMREKFLEALIRVEDLSRPGLRIDVPQPTGLEEGIASLAEDTRAFGHQPGLPLGAQAAGAGTLEALAHVSGVIRNLFSAFGIGDEEIQTLGPGGRPPTEDSNIQAIQDPRVALSDETFESLTPAQKNLRAVERFVDSFVRRGSFGILPALRGEARTTEGAIVQGEIQAPQSGREAAASFAGELAGDFALGASTFGATKLALTPLLTRTALGGKALAGFARRAAPIAAASDEASALRTFFAQRLGGGRGISEAAAREALGGRAGADVLSSLIADPLSGGLTEVFLAKTIFEEMGIAPDDEIELFGWSTTPRFLTLAAAFTGFAGGLVGGTFLNMGEARHANRAIKQVTDVSRAASATELVDGTIVNGKLYDASLNRWRDPETKGFVKAPTEEELIERGIERVREMASEAEVAVDEEAVTRKAARLEPEDRDLFEQNTTIAELRYMETAGARISRGDPEDPTLQREIDFLRLMAADPEQPEIVRATALGRARAIQRVLAQRGVLEVPDDFEAAGIDITSAADKAISATGGDPESLNNLRGLFQRESNRAQNKELRNYWRALEERVTGLIESGDFETQNQVIRQRIDEETLRLSRGASKGSHIELDGAVGEIIDEPRLGLARVRFPDEGVRQVDIAEEGANVIPKAGDYVELEDGSVGFVDQLVEGERIIAVVKPDGTRLIAQYPDIRRVGHQTSTHRELRNAFDDAAELKFRGGVPVEGDPPAMIRGSGERVTIRAISEDRAQVVNRFGQERVVKREDLVTGDEFAPARSDLIDTEGDSDLAQSIQKFKQAREKLDNLPDDTPASRLNALRGARTRAFNQMLETAEERGFDLEDLLPIISDEPIPPSGGKIHTFSAGLRPSEGRHINFVEVPEEEVPALRRAVEQGRPISSVLARRPILLFPQQPKPGFKLMALELPAEGRKLTSASKRVLGILTGKVDPDKFNHQSVRARVRVEPEALDDAVVYEVPEGLQANINSPSKIAQMDKEAKRDYLRRLQDLGFEPSTPLWRQQLPMRQQAQRAVVARRQGDVGGEEVANIRSKHHRALAAVEAIKQVTTDLRTLGRAVVDVLSRQLEGQDLYDAAELGDKRAFWRVLQDLPISDDRAGNLQQAVFSHPDVAGLRYVVWKERAGVGANERTVYHSEIILPTGVAKDRKTWDPISTRNIKVPRSIRDEAGAALNRAVTLDQNVIDVLDDILAQRQTTRVGRVKIQFMDQGKPAEVDPETGEILKEATDPKLRSRTVRARLEPGEEEGIFVARIRRKDREKISEEFEISLNEINRSIRVREEDVKGLKVKEEPLVEVPVRGLENQDESVMLEQIRLDAENFVPRANSYSAGEYRHPSAPGLVGTIHPDARAGNFKAKLYLEPSESEGFANGARFVGSRNFASRAEADAFLRGELGMDRFPMSSGVGSATLKMFELLPDPETLDDATLRKMATSKRRIEVSEDDPVLGEIAAAERQARLAEIEEADMRELIAEEPLTLPSLNTVLEAAVDHFGGYLPPHMRRYAIDVSSEYIKRGLGDRLPLNRVINKAAGIDLARSGFHRERHARGLLSVGVEQAEPEDTDLASFIDRRFLDAHMPLRGEQAAAAARAEKWMQNQERFMDLSDRYGLPDFEAGALDGSSVVRFGPRERLGIIADARIGKNDLDVIFIGEDGQPRIARVPKDQVTRRLMKETQQKARQLMGMSTGEIESFPRTMDPGHHQLDIDVGFAGIDDPVAIRRAFAERLNKLEDEGVVNAAGPELIGDPDDVQAMANMYRRARELEAFTDIDPERKPIKLVKDEQLKELLEDVALEQIADEYSPVGELGRFMAAAKMGKLTRGQMDAIRELAGRFRLPVEGRPLWQVAEDLVEQAYDPITDTRLFYLRNDAGFMRLSRAGQLPANLVNVRSSIFNSTSLNYLSSYFALPRTAADRHPSFKIGYSQISKAQIKENNAFKSANAEIEYIREVLPALPLGHPRRKKVDIENSTKLMRLAEHEALTEAVDHPGDFPTWRQVKEVLSDEQQAELAPHTGNFDDMRRAYEAYRENVTARREDMIETALRRGFQIKRVTGEMVNEEPETYFKILRQSGLSDEEIDALNLDDVVYVFDRNASRESARTHTEAREFIHLLDAYRSAADIPEEVASMLESSGKQWMMDEFDYWKNFGIKSYWPYIHQGSFVIRLKTPEGQTDKVVGWAPSGYEAHQVIKRALAEEAHGPDAAYEVIHKGVDLDDVAMQYIPRTRFAKIFSRLSTIANVDADETARLLGQRGRLAPTPGIPPNVNAFQRNANLRGVFEDPLRELAIYNSRIIRHKYLVDIEDALDLVEQLDPSISRAFGLDPLLTDERTGLGVMWQELKKKARMEPSSQELLMDAVTTAIAHPVGAANALLDKLAGGEITMEAFIREFYARPFAGRQLSDRALATQSIIRLGFAPASALVNMLQFFVNTGSKVTNRELIGALNDLSRYSRQSARDKAELAVEAGQGVGFIRQKLATDTERGRELTRIAREAGVAVVPSKAMAGTEKLIGDVPVVFADEHIGKSLLKYGQYYGMWLFNRAESFNRLGTAFAMARQAKKLGMVDDAGRLTEAGLEHVRQGIEETQFQYTDIALNRIMSGPAVKVLTQFKPFLAGQTKFLKDLGVQSMGELASGGAKGFENTKALAKHTFIMTALGGLAFYTDNPITTGAGALFEAVGGGQLKELLGVDTSIEESLAAQGFDASRDRINASQDSKILRLKDLVYYGLPGYLFGVNIGQRLGVSGQDLDPRRWQDILLGPHVGMYAAMGEAMIDFWQRKKDIQQQGDVGRGIAMGLAMNTLLKMNPRTRRFNLEAIPLTPFGSQLTGLWLGSAGSEIPFGPPIGRDKGGHYLGTTQAGRQLMQETMPSEIRNFVQFAELIHFMGVGDDRGELRGTSIQPTIFPEGPTRNHTAAARLFGFQTADSHRERMYLDWKRKENEKRRRGAETIASLLAQIYDEGGGYTNQMMELIETANLNGIEVDQADITRALEQRNVDRVQQIIENMLLTTRLEDPEELDFSNIMKNLGLGN